MLSQCNYYSLTNLACQDSFWITLGLTNESCIAIILTDIRQMLDPRLLGKNSLAGVFFILKRKRPEQRTNILSVRKPSKTTGSGVLQTSI